MATQANVTSAMVLDALRKVTDPGSGKDFVSLGLVANVRVQAGKVSFDIYVPSHAEGHMPELRAAATTAVKTIPGVVAVMPNLFKKPKPRVVHGQQAVPGVNHVIVVGSGKGGVGKSTSSVNLAMGLKKLGYNVGLLDADIYGPSVPTMLGKDLPRDAANGTQASTEDNQLIPMDLQGVKVISLGLLIGRDQPTVWRAPMATKMIQQFLLGVKWGDLDFLIVDLPPGTGDIQLTLSQQANITGAIVVTTPQQVAIDIARKGLLMFKHVGLPILGVMETMSGFACGDCGSVTSIFGEGGAKRLAAEDGVQLLGQIPVDAALVRACDEGEPIVLRDPKSPSAQAYMAAAAKVVATVEAMTSDPTEKDIVPLAVEPMPAPAAGGEHRLAVYWSDGQKYTYNARALRFACPCAVCVDEFSGERRITMDAVPADIALEKALPVGRYGINLVWNDKHATGIYTYRYLRELDSEKTTERPGPPPEMAQAKA
jgi:ATP-binding protein involved in chromosome partitioning